MERKIENLDTEILNENLKRNRREIDRKEKNEKANRRRIKKSKKLFKLIILIVFVLLVFGGIKYVLQKNNEDIKINNIIEFGDVVRDSKIIMKEEGKELEELNKVEAYRVEELEKLGYEKNVSYVLEKEDRKIMAMEFQNTKDNLKSVRMYISEDEKGYLKKSVPSEEQYSKINSEILTDVIIYEDTDGIISARYKKKQDMFTEYLIEGNPNIKLEDMLKILKEIRNY